MISLRILLLSVVVGVLCLSQSLPAEDLTRQQGISEAQTKLATARTEVERLLGTQAGIYDQLDKVETELELSSRLLRELRQQSKTVTAEIAATIDTIGRLQRKSLSENVNFALHLRSIYKQGRQQEPTFPFATGKTDGSLGQDYLYRRMIAGEKKQLSDLNIDISGHRRLLTTLTARKEELAALTRARLAEERQAKQAVRQRDKLLAKVKGEQRQKLREISELEESSQMLEDIVAQTESKRETTRDALWPKEHELTLRMRGKLDWPVAGNIVTSFGLKRDNKSGLSSKSNGINIATSTGAKVVAALTGEVLYIGWARGLEKFAVVDHGGSIYSLYGNLDELSVSEGDQVIRGEQFATTAGNRLHFEIRDGKLPVDPTEWLRK
jgi:septal ring factor EnvC (AmiA/AmiB activator)